MASCQNQFIGRNCISILGYNSLDFIIFYYKISDAGFKQNLSAAFNYFLTNILNDFLSLDKLDQNKVASNPSKFDLIQFIENMAVEFRDPNDRQNVFEVKHKNREILVFQDKDMIRNVLINLVSNAIKYSAELSTITISTQVKDSSVILEIQDHGMGIPKEDQKHLFETFFRAHNVSYLQGTGLGLNIVKRYLDLMGGNIEFTSIENEGSTFKVILPLEKP